MSKEEMAEQDSKYTGEYIGRTVFLSDPGQVVPTEDPKLTEAKKHREQFKAFCDSLGSTRELSLAKTHIDNAFLWLKEHLQK